MESSVRYLLNVSYLALLVVIFPWLLWNAVLRGKYREGWSAKLWGDIPRRDESRDRCIWFHAVSVGEVQMLSKLLGRAAERWPDCECVISTTTKTGFELAKKRYPEHRVFYCPLDFSWAVGRALRRMRPDLLVLVELELWPNMIAEAARQGVRVAIINGRLSDNSFRGYSRIRRWLLPTWQRIDVLAAQNQEYAERFRHLGAKDVQVTGSLKFEDIQTDRENPATQSLVRAGNFQPSDVVFLAGSTQAPEEEMALQTFAELSEDWPMLKLVLVPRHPHRFEEVALLLDQSSYTWQRRSMLSEGEAAGGSRILLVDTVGELAAWWGVAQIAFVGGSMGSRGGQNMIEPAAFGAAVSFGPHTHNFREVVQMLLQNDAATVISDQAALTANVRRCLEESDWRHQMGTRAQAVVSRQSGAADRTLDLLASWLPSSRRSAA